MDMNVNERQITYNPDKTCLYDGSQNWHHRPPEIGLAHELIHAYHNDTGLDIGDDIEEQRTVGLGPYIGTTITENDIRNDYGIIQRPEY